jgi:hypothetical protein
MSQTDVISGMDLALIVRKSGRTGSAVLEAAEIAEAHSDETFRVAEIARKSLIETFERRVSRLIALQKSSLELEQLLEDLTQASDESLRAVAIEHSGKIAAIWLNEDSTQLVGCYVGGDARYETSETNQVP